MLENVALDLGQKMNVNDNGIVSYEMGTRLNLLDFRKLLPYVDKQTGSHLKQQKCETFNGSFIFSSPNEISFKTTSRKDDLISLAFMMMYLMNGANLPQFDLPHSAKNNVQKKLYFCQVYKNQSLKKLSHIGKLNDFEHFCSEIDSLGFESKPNYAKLRSILKGLIMHENQISFQLQEEREMKNIVLAAAAVARAREPCGYYDPQSFRRIKDARKLMKSNPMGRDSCI